jgi:hypothetical protein
MRGNVTPSIHPGLTDSGAHERAGGAPGAVTFRAADGADTGGIDRAGRQAGDDKVAGVGKNPRLQPRTRGEAVLHLVGARVLHGLQIDR